MKRTPHSIQRLTQTIAWSLSVMIALLAPSVYYLISYQYMRGVLEAQTELRAQEVSRVIHANPVMWRFEEVRISELLGRRSTDDVAETIRITDVNGASVAKNDVVTDPPRTRHIHDIYDAGHVAAHIEVSRSLKPLLYRTFLTASGSTAIALIVFFMLRTLPLRAIHKAITALRESENKYRSLYETMKEGMAIHRIRRDDIGAVASLELIDANPNCIAMLGGDWQRIIGNDSLALFGPAFRQHLAELVQVEKQKGFFSFDLAMPGDTYYIVHAFSPDQGLVATLFEDITERKKAEEERLHLERQLQHAQKLESLGILAGGIAHDFNNLLHALLGNLDLALMKLPGDASVRRNIEQAVSAGRQAAKLTGMMLAYTGKGLFVIRNMDLTALVETNARMLQAAIPRVITFDLALDHELPPIMADEGQLQQVVMNLITNAAEAIGDRQGVIRLSTGLREFDQEALNASRLEKKLLPGPYVFVEVRDDGCGMNEEILNKLFDPFFTTKFTGRGLGMAAVLGIIRAHEGAFLVESSPNAGTTIRILFPIAAASKKEQPDKAPAAHAASLGIQPSATILIVDDEEMIRGVASDMLKELGFRTLAVGDGEEALSVIRAQGDGIDLVLLDQNMPRMDGAAVFREMKAIRPDIKVLLATGFSEVEVAERFKGLGLDGFIQKPYDLEHLSDGLRRALKS